MDVVRALSRYLMNYLWPKFKTVEEFLTVGNLI